MRLYKFYITFAGATVTIVFNVGPSAIYNTLRVSVVRTPVHCPYCIIAFREEKNDKNK